MITSPTIRQLTATDAAAFRTLRLAGLLEAPTAFGSSYGREKARTVEDFAGTIARNHMVGAFAEGRLVGVAGSIRRRARRTDIRATSGACMWSRRIGAPVLRGR